MNPIQRENIKRYLNGSIHGFEDHIAREYDLTLVLNGSRFVTFICTPEDVKELAVGYLLSESIIEHYKEIKSITFHDTNQDSGELHVSIEKELQYQYINDDIYIVRKINTSCGKNRIYHLPALKRISQRETYDIINYEKIDHVMENFNKKSTLYKETRAVHSCGISDENDVLAFAEDISRHNAADKVIGKAAMSQITTSDTIFYTSGRISSEIVQKIAATEIGTIVSRSVPTYRAVELGKRYKINIIGLVRSGRMNLYTSTSD